MEHYWDELITLSFIVFLGAMSPGPDWAIVAKNALTKSRYAGMYSAFGVATAILIHMSYCLFGVGLIIAQSPFLFNGIKYLGSTYLCYLGIKGVRAKQAKNSNLEKSASNQDWSYKKSFTEGFVTNLLNPKAALFFLSLFSLVIDPGTPSWVLFIYAFDVVLITLIWFCFLAFALSSQRMRESLNTYQHWVERVLGFALIALGIFIAFT